MKTVKRSILVLTMIGLFLILTTPGALALKPVTLEWSCGSVGGGWYTMGAGIAEIV
ncbi:MAG: hypothetical protein ACYS5V_10535 [Planctomycetota bacterium]|jgi:TRAP-type uncharacterized transport system substrate-binding protein